MADLGKVTVTFLFLVLCCFSLSLHEGKGKVAHKESHQCCPFGRPSTFIIFASAPEAKLETFNLTSLNDTQKEVDKFIREKAKLGDANLTSAQGNGQRYVYRYENKSENKNQTWIISAALNEDEDQNDTTSHFQTTPATVTPTFIEPIPNPPPSPTPGSNSPAPANTQPQNQSPATAEKKPDTPKPKYVITGIVYTESTKLTEEQKAKLKEQQKKRQEEMKKFQEELKKQFEEQKKKWQSFGDPFDSWSLF